MNNPNIFSCGTTELTQDAVMVWLIGWADEQHVGHDMYQAGQCFVKSLLAEEYTQAITKIKVGRQWKNIDVWIEINDDLFVIIENKQGTQPHNNQLKRYKQEAEEYYQDRGRKIECIYVQSIIESSSHKKEIEDCGYKYVGFSTLKEIIDNCSQDKKNDILHDYQMYLNNHLDIHKGWDTQVINQGDKLDWHHCYGLYKYLEDKFGEEFFYWGYAPNPSGGTQWFLFNDTWCSINIPGVMDAHDISTYLQLENDSKGLRLVVKTYSASAESRQYLREYRQKLLTFLQNEYGKNGFHKVVKYGTFRPGTYTSTAVIYLDEENYIPINNDGTINTSLLVEQLKKARLLFFKLANN